MNDEKDRYGGFDKEVLLGIYSALNATQLDYNERKWETIKLASTVTLGIFVAVGGLAATGKLSGVLYIIIGVILWGLGYWLFSWTNHNMEREARLQYHVEFPMYQIEKLLGVHGEVPENLRWFPKNKYIFGKKHIEAEFRASLDTNKPSVIDGLEKDPENVWVESRIKHHEFLDNILEFSFLLLSIWAIVGLAFIGFGIVNLVN